MSGKSGRSSGTQEMETLKDDAAPAARSPVGKRTFGGSEQRGLAAYDRQPDKPALGSVRDTGDDELRRARIEAHEAAQDDGMVVTSASNWADVAAPVRKGGRAAAPAVVAEDEADEAPPRRRGGAWKWIVGVVVVGGVGAFFGVSALRGAPAAPKAVTQVAAAPSAKPRPAATAEHEGSDNGASDNDTVAADKAAEDKAAEDKAAEDKAAEDKAAAEKAAVGKTERASTLSVTPASSEPAAWAASVEARNPWVSVAAAPAGTGLGLSDSEANDALAASRTGFRPSARVTAPVVTYRIESHEVTWGELALATTLKEAAAPPQWLPHDPKRQANLPATGVPWQMADAFCRGLGGDLPSEAEWEWAARGSELRYFPWGREAFTPSEVHITAGRPVPVVAVATSKLDHTPGDAPIWDLLGNAQEWTRDPFRAADPAAAADPKISTRKAIRGWPLGAPGAPTPAEGATYRSSGCADPSCLATEVLEHVGFRCVRGG